jgi:thioesterase domain-containing protein
VFNDLKSHLKPGYKTYVTGHSLGGAVAAILTIYLIEDGVQVERVVTFGQPRFTTTDGIGEFWRSLSFADLKDHEMQKYLRRIASKATGARQVPYNQREKYVVSSAEQVVH